MTRRPLAQREGDTLRKVSPFAFGIGLAVAIACGSDNVRRAAEEVQVVGGTPTVGQGLPGVNRGDGGMDASFGPAAPFQVDIFDQHPVQQVDILWVIDNSSSMQAKQNRLGDNISAFMDFLKTQTVDYHLGVVSTDTFDPAQSGRLQNKAGLPQPWITPSDVNAKADFLKNIGLGELGSGDEKGLLGGMMALTPPLSPAVNPNPANGALNCAGSGASVECFLRPAAALYTIIISDEEDSSCSPIQSGGLMSGEGCLDADIRDGGYGSTDYWSRFFVGARDGGVSRVATIVSTDSTTRDCATELSGFCDHTPPPNTTSICASGTHPDCTQTIGADPCCNAIAQCNIDIAVKAQRCHVQPVNTAGHTTGWAITGQWNGCKSQASDGGIDFTAIYAPRYATVAQATGGIASSICDLDYTPALQKLGLQASGLRSEFPLSRAPLAGSVTVAMTPAPTPAIAATYVDCENHAPVNLVSFASPPAAGTRIAISYNVNVRGLVCP